jgi:hypothetical protein
VFDIAREILSQVIEGNWKEDRQSINELDIYPALRGAASEQMAAAFPVGGDEMEVETWNLQGSHEGWCKKTDDVHFILLKSKVGWFFVISTTGR